MGTLAGMLKQRGYDVSGSDENVYPPMSEMLQKWGIDIYRGYDEKNIGKPDLVIIGNVISRGNIEAEYALDNRIPYLSMAQSLYNFFLKDKEVVSISGTHGKTTVTALLSHILTAAGEEPSFLVGGVSKNYGANYKMGAGKYFIIEGDEYDSAFFEKIPKFIVYRPHHLILTSLEFDHADIYNNLDEIKLWFKRLVNLIPSNGNIVYSGEYQRLEELANNKYSKSYSFGKPESEFGCQFLGFSDIYANLKITNKTREDIDLRTQLFGDFNYSNISAAVSMALLLGVKKEHIQSAVESFEGVKRRQELIYNSESIKVYEDFAHHPTAIKSILNGIKQKYKDSIIWAIYEPRSATSRRNILENELTGSFYSADKILIKTPYNLDLIAKSDRIDIDKVIRDIKNEKKEARLFENADKIVEFTCNEIDIKMNNIIVIMSNGGFDGIYGKLIDRIKKLHIRSREKSC